MAVLPFDPETVAKSAMARASSKPDARQPLYRTPPRREPYPIEALLGLQHVAKAMQHATQAPIELVANSLLGATSLVAMPHYDVRLLPPPHEAVALSLFLLSIAESGERKTTIDKMVLRPIELQQTDWRRRYQENNYKKLADIKAWKARSKRLEQVYRDNLDAMTAAIVELGPEPTMPMSPQLLLGDATTEAISQHLALRPWGGLFSSEGGTLLGNSSWTDDRIIQTGGQYQSAMGWSHRRPQPGVNRRGVSVRTALGHAPDDPSRHLRPVVW